MVPIGGYAPPTNALSRRYLTIRSNGRLMAEDIGIEPISLFLSGSLANSCRTLQHIFQMNSPRNIIINCNKNSVKSSASYVEVTVKLAKDLDKHRNKAKLEYYTEEVSNFIAIRLSKSLWDLESQLWARADYL